jgi:acyl carrier protein
MDSLAFVEFLVALEEEFGLNLSEDSLRLREIATVADMVVFIEPLTSTNAR